MDSGAALKKDAMSPRIMWGEPQRVPNGRMKSEGPIAKKRDKLWVPQIYICERKNFVLRIFRIVEELSEVLVWGYQSGCCSHGDDYDFAGLSFEIFFYGELQRLKS